jgi:hypothetical protein
VSHVHVFKSVHGGACEEATNSKVKKQSKHTQECPKVSVHANPKLTLHRLEPSLDRAYHHLVYLDESLLSHFALMNLPRHTLSSHALSPTFVNAQFTALTDRQEIDSSQQATSGLALGNERASSRSRNAQGKQRSKDAIDNGGNDASMFACATNQGYFIARTHPLSVVARRGE